MKSSIVAVVLALTVALAAAGCGSRQATTPAPPTAPEALVLRVEQRGGLQPPGAQVSAVPEFSLYGDGRVVALARPRPASAGGRGPALPHLQTRRLSPAGVRRVMVAAQDAGLLRRQDYGIPALADGPATTFTVVANGERHVTTVGALADDHGVGRLTEAQRHARARLEELRSRLSFLESWIEQAVLGASRPYRFDALAVVVTPAGVDPGGSGTADRKRWPLADLGSAGASTTGGRCLVVRGAELDELLPVARQGSITTRWLSDGTAYHLQLRPLLPDERGCADLGL